MFFALPTSAKVPNDPQYQIQAPMYNQINAPTAWDYSVGSRKVIVAVIDTGADTWHPDLTKNIWVNRHEIPDNGLDDDKNGFIDDINGWNFVERNNNARTGVFDKDDDREAVHHGTVVAGLVGAEGNNGHDGTGINWQVQIMPLRAMNSLGSGAMSEVAQAVLYAVDNGAQVISMSFVGEKSDIRLLAALKVAYTRGVVIVAAAGNGQNSGAGDLDTKPIFPICSDQGDKENWILGTTAVDSNDRLSYFANYGSCVDLTAPGENIYSTERYAPAYGYNNDFGGRWQGTSFTAPLVAGAAALIKSIRPDWGAKEIIANLLSTADNIDDVNPTVSGRLGYGRLNLGAAAAAAMASKPVTSADKLLSYFTSGQIKQYNLDKNITKTLARYADNFQIVGLRSGDINDDFNNEILLLIKRDKYFYIRILKGDGSFWFEFPVGDEDLLKVKAASVKNFEVLFNDRPAKVVVEQTSAGTTTRQFKEYNFGGRKIREVEVKDKIALWRLNDLNGNLVLAKLDKKGLSVGEVNWLGESTEDFNLTGVTALDDMQLGNLFGGNNRQLVFVARLAKGLAQQYVMDLNSQSFVKENLGLAKVKWSLQVFDNASGDPANILRYTAGKGTATLFTAKGGAIKTLKLPKLY